MDGSMSDELLRDKYPHMCSFAIDQNITLQKSVDICRNEDIYDMFHLPLSMLAYN
jgi:hypothetical protein